jgi:hypothetical protein
MRNQLLALVAGGLVSLGGWTSWSSTVAADEPVPSVPVQAAISTDSGSVPVQLVDRRWRRGWRSSYYGDRYYGGYYPYGSYYSYPRYRYYSYSYPRYYYPYSGYYSSYYDPYYYRPGIYFTW